VLARCKKVVRYFSRNYNKRCGIPISKRIPLKIIPNKAVDTKRKKKKKKIVVKLFVNISRMLRKKKKG
jgi:hypothetical protein